MVRRRQRWVTMVIGVVKDGGDDRNDIICGWSTLIVCKYVILNIVSQILITLLFRSWCILVIFMACFT